MKQTGPFWPPLSQGGIGSGPRTDQECAFGACNAGESILKDVPIHESWAAMIRFTCPKCKTILQVAPQQAGAIIACSQCKTQMKVPPPQVVPPPLPVKPSSPAPVTSQQSSPAPVTSQTTGRAPVSSGAPSGRQERLKALGEKLKSTWQGLTPRRKAAVLGGSGAFILLSFALCCGVCGFFGLRDSSPRLTEEYSPHIPGRVREYVTKSYTDARYSGVHRVTELPDGTEKMERADGTGGVQINYRRVQNGFIEWGYKKGSDIDYRQEFKLGAKVGDSWTNGKGNVTRTFSEFVVHSGKPCVAITLKQFDKGDHYYTVTNWYMKGVGIVHYTVQRKVKGKWETEKEIAYKEW